MHIPLHLKKHSFKLCEKYTYVKKKLSKINKSKIS